MTAVGGLLIVLVAVLVHEAGHAAAAQALGLRWQLFARLPWAAGVAIRVPEGGLKPRDDLLIALAGPTASLSLAAAAHPFHLELALLSGLLGMLNLLPFIRGSDGWRATQAIRSLHAAPARSRT